MKNIIATLVATTIISTPTVLAAPQESISLDTFLTETIEQVTSTAYNEIGYIEKASNYNLYDKTANAGYNNYTKYANDLAIWRFYAGNLNGLAWCDMFVDWCFCTAYGVEDAKIITNQFPYGSASCVTSKGYFQAVGQFYQTPQPGDQIFFTGSHTGLVYKIEGNTVYTIEGNTNPSSGNDGLVAMKYYDLNNRRIAGYGRPNYMAIAHYRYTNYKAECQEKEEQEKRKKHFCRPTDETGIFCIDGSKGEDI